MNALKTTVLLGALSGLVLLAGYYFGGEQGMTVALIFALIMNFGSYWFSDKIVLKIYRAEEISETDNPRLHTIVQDLTRAANMKMPRLYLVDMPVPNAFATGRNQSHAVVAVTKGILELLDESELRAVLAHELGHVLNRDILVSSVAATLAAMISYVAQMALFFGGGDRNRSNPIAMLVFIILTPVMAAIIQMAISRTREFGADATSATITGNPMDLARALQKLDTYSHRYPLKGQPKHEATAHLFIVNPFRASFLSKLFSTHPPMDERVRRLEEMAEGRI